MLDVSGLNYWAILVATLINIIVGSFWYSPAGFGKRWSKLSGVDMMKMPKDAANKPIGFVMASALIQASVLAVVINSLDANTLSQGVAVGLVVWLGFTAATTVGNTLYSRQSWSFWWLNSSFFLLVMIINSAILAVWS